MTKEDIFDELADDAEAFSGASEKNVKDIGALASQLMQHEAEQASMEETLKGMKKKRTALAFALAEALEAANMNSFETTDGHTVKLVKSIKAAIPKNEKQAAEAEQWLIDNGHGDLIKYTIEANLDRTQHNMAGEIVARLKSDYEIEASSRASVNSNTLSAFVREQLRNGKKVNEKVLGVFHHKDVQVK